MTTGRINQVTVQRPRARARKWLGGATGARQQSRARSPPPEYVTVKLYVSTNAPHGRPRARACDIARTARLELCPPVARPGRARPQSS